MKRAAVGSGLAIVALAAMFLVWEATRDRPDPDPVGPASAADSPVTSEPEAPPAASGQSSGPDPDASDAPKPAPAAAADPPPDPNPSSGAGPALAPEKPTPPVKPRWLVRGRILDLPPADDRPFRVEVSPVFLRGFPGEAKVCPGGEAGRFEADVTALVTLDPPPEEFEVVVNHPAFIPRLCRVKRVDGRKEGDSLTVFSIEVRLHPAVAVCGTVRASSGKPLAGVDVALFRMKEGQPIPLPLRATRTDAAGRFVLQTVQTAPCLVVADDPDRQPTSAPAEPTPGGAAGEVDLILSDGLAITGRVLRAGQPPRPGVNVFLEPSADAPQVVGLAWRRGQSLVWESGRVVRQRPYARTDAKGRYRIAGLAPGPVNVRLTDRIFGTDEPTVQRRVVQPPAANVDFTIGGVPHTFTVEADGVALERVRLTFTGVHLGSAMIGSSRGITLNLEAGKAYRVRVQHPACVTHELDLVARDSIEPVEVKIRLELAPECATLAGTVVAAGGRPPDRVHGWFERGEGRARKIFRHVVPARAGKFEVRGIPPGRYLVRLRGGPHRMSGGYLTAAEQTIEFPSRGRVEARFELNQGGRIRLFVRDREGRFVSKPCRVRDATGQVLKLWFAARGTGGASTGSTSHRGPAETDPPLPPGRYRVEFFRGRQKEVVKTLPVEVKAGRTTDVEWVVDG